MVAMSKYYYNLLIKFINNICQCLFLIRGPNRSTTDCYKLSWLSCYWKKLKKERLCFLDEVCLTSNLFRKHLLQLTESLRL
jgi:hypothetical protein